MVSTALRTGPPADDRDAAPRAGRRSPVPDAPSYSRRELEVFDEVDGALGFVLWRVISDVLVWARAAPAERAGLLSGGGTPAALLEEGLALAEPVAGDLRALAALDAASDPERVAAACGRVAEWAEGAELKGAALQFAELAAWAHPESAVFATSAGRLCRRRGEFERAKLWLRRALRIARREGNEIDFAEAHRGLGFVLVEEGKFAAAEPHFWKCIRAALRQGRRSIAGAGYHNLLLTAVHLEQWDDADVYAQRAIEFYKVGYPSLPELAHDVGFFWCRLGYYSSALPLFEEALPLIQRSRDGILVHASIARSSAVVRDNLRFQRAASHVMELVDPRSEYAASALYHVAEGARCFLDWERAERLGQEALRLATERRNVVVRRWAEDLLGAIQLRIPGEMDAIPPENGVIDTCRGRLMKKLQRHRTAVVKPRNPAAADE